jgi:hypothetical protein
VSEHRHGPRPGGRRCRPAHPYHQTRSWGCCSGRAGAARRDRRGTPGRCRRSGWDWPHGAPTPRMPSRTAVPAETPQGSESFSALPAQSRCRHCPGSVGADTHQGDTHQGVALALVADFFDAPCPGRVRRGVPLDGNPADGHRPGALPAMGVVAPSTLIPRQPPSRVPDEAPGPRRRLLGHPPAGTVVGEHRLRPADAHPMQQAPEGVMVGGEQEEIS